eukprot:TRINITY_DN23183_c0_g1_i1.p1 TRINITY_DN23183_c0_g1~~TRINITY_DN23183_c0_g1_i1.p1  ORF type:complete len:220 (-),score=2.56 TRINITY_DN23183_c0_g1_i1:51-710(-)
MGRAVWFSYALPKPLCHMSPVVSFLRKLAKRLSADVLLWDVEEEIPESVVRSLTEVIKKLEINAWITPLSFLAANGPSEHIWSDASSSMWGYILASQKDASNQGVFRAEWSQAHIYLKELGAVLEGVFALKHARPDSSPSRVVLHIDNAAVVSSIRKGHSSNFAANQMLAELFDLAEEEKMYLDPVWVDTLSQRADGITRDVRLDHPSPPLFFPPHCSM